MGRDLTSLRPMELARCMAVVLTEKVSPPLLSVFEFVALGRYPHTDFLGRLDAADRQIVEEMLSAVHARHLAGRPFADLSDGERQKALVARALAQKPRLILLDEPTLHLDLKHRLEVMSILRDLCRSQGIAVLASLHDVDVAAKVSDEVALLKDGRLSAWGAPESILTGDAVTRLYDIEGARFNQHLGGIELCGQGRRGRLFVVAGMGSGALVYRSLAKAGFSITTGVLHKNDLDCYVAQSLGAECLTQSPAQEIDEPLVRAANEIMPTCDAIIDCGFEVGSLNQGNLHLLDAALQTGKPVLSLRNNGTSQVRESAAPASPVHCRDTVHLLQTLDTLLASGQQRETL
jgi:iron complex transport system ATP-binding protein